MGRDVDKHTTAIEARIEHICDLMRALKWRTGESVKVLAAEWDMSVARAYELSAEASKRVRAEICDPDRVAADTGAMATKIMHEAYLEGDRKYALEAAKVLADLSGAKAPQRIEATVTSAPADLAAKIDRLVGGSRGDE